MTEEQFKKEAKGCPFCGEKPKLVQAKGGLHKGLQRAFHRCKAISWQIRISDWAEDVRPGLKKWNTRIKP